MDESFASLMDEVTDGGLLSNYIVIAEVMTDDGFDLRVAGPANITPWTALGMLQFAKGVILNNEDTEDDL
jgi:hypothetical protein